MYTRYSSVNKSSNKSKDSGINPSEFFNAIKSGDLEKSQQFFDDPNIKTWELKDENDYTALHFSVFNNNFDMTSLILEEVKKGLGINSTKKLENFINTKNKEGFTALHYSVIIGNIKIFELLKKFGASVDAITNNGKNLMHLAAESNQPSMIVYLYLKEAQEINSIDEMGSTPLHWACYYKAEESVNYLLNFNADINAKDKDLITPLSMAVASKKESLVKLLLRKGADPYIKNKNNKIPLDIAKKKNYKKIVQILTSEYNSLCSTEIPDTYAKPTDIYKKVILFLLIICEGIIFILVLPFLKKFIFSILNFVFFGLGLLSYFMLIWSDSDYQKNKALVNECGGEDNYICLEKLVESGEDLKKYCPVCYVLRSNNIKHCFLCNKCVKDLGHHCFWFNKCISRKNRVIYIIFLICNFLNCIYSMLICSNLIFDRVSIPYEHILPTWIYLGIDRGLRVLGANIVLLIAMLGSYPLFFMFMIEMFKLCGLLGKKNKDFENLENNDAKNNLLIDGNKDIEMQNQKDDLLLNDINEENDEKNKIDIPKENIPFGDGRLSDGDNQDENENQNIIENKNENIIENDN